MKRLLRRAIPGLLLIASPAFAADLVLPDVGARAQAAARLADIERQLLTADSATLTLEKWCATHRMADPARIVVQRGGGAEHPARRAERGLLGVSASTPVRYRRVRLACGSHVLSEAENWYVPGRLEPAMNAALDGSDAPFGKVIRPLAPTRRTLSGRQIWAGIPREAGCDRTVFTHRALVLDGKGRPLALVVENYKLELICGIRGTATAGPPVDSKQQDAIPD